MSKTYAIEVLEGLERDVLVNEQEVIAELSESLNIANISHVVLFKHNYINTPFGVQENYG